MSESREDRAWQRMRYDNLKRVQESGSHAEAVQRRVSRHVGAVRVSTNADGCGKTTPGS